MTKCEHDFKPIGDKKKRPFLSRVFAWILPPNTYSKCSKCGLLRHDRDGHTFKTVDEAIRSAEK